ncbi:hypothetical protein Q604_UNBc4C00174G0001, partial [human gut metagenome]
FSSLSYPESAITLEYLNPVCFWIDFKKVINVVVSVGWGPILTQTIY